MQLIRIAALLVYGEVQAFVCVCCLPKRSPMLRVVPSSEAYKQRETASASCADAIRR